MRGEPLLGGTPAGDWRPNLFVVGAPRCATTWLHEALARHPAIYMSRHKEPHYFADFELEPRRMAAFGVVRAPEAYARLFAGAERSVVRGESSTSYLASRGAPERIASFNAEARVVAILRDPVERAHSHYLTDLREGHEKRSFADAVRDELDADGAWPALYVEAGRYAAQVGRYLECFGERALILVFDDLAAEPARTIGRVLDFLGLDGAAPCSAPAAPANAYERARGRVSGALLRSPAARRLARTVVPQQARGAVRGRLVRSAAKPPLDDEARRVLGETYRPDVRELERLLGRALPWLDAPAARG
jgi:Sulfotransferase family